MNVDLRVKHLTVHEAISDCLHRFVMGLDEANEALIRSAMTSEVVFDLSPFGALQGKGSASRFGTTSGIDAVVAQLMGHVGPMDTSHMCTNIRTSVASDSTSGHMTAYGLAQHWRPGHGRSTALDKDFLCGNRYVADLIFDDGLWKFTKFQITPMWQKGDSGVPNSSTWGPMNEVVKNSLEMYGHVANSGSTS